MSLEKMIWIQHRTNTVEALFKIHPLFGAEIDLRSNLHETGKIHLSHDPWVLGEDFETWIKLWKNRQIQGPLILNTKEDNLETRILEILKTYQISSFFFLDTPLPTLIRWTQKNKEPRFALRYSCYEPLASILPFQRTVEWVWLDCFDGEPWIEIENLQKLRTLNFKICLVSPELQTQKLEGFKKFQPLIQYLDAICTKSPDHWIKAYSHNHSTCCLS